MKKVNIRDKAQREFLMLLEVEKNNYYVEKLRSIIQKQITENQMEILRAILLEGKTMKMLAEEKNVQKSVVYVTFDRTQKKLDDVVTINASVILNVIKDVNGDNLCELMVYSLN